MKGIFTLLSGAAIGAGLMYLFDPNGGNRRRALIRDKAFSFNRRAQRAISGRMEDLSNRAKGMYHETRSMLSGEAGGETAEPMDQPIH